MKARSVFLILLTMFSLTVVGQGSVTVAATKGGSVTFTPEGVFKTEASNSPKLKAIQGTKLKAVLVDTIKLVSYPINDISLDEAKLIRNTLAAVAYDENPNATDWKAFMDTRTFVIANKDFKNSTKKLSIQVSDTMMERILQNSSYYSGMYNGNTMKDIQENYDRAVRTVNLRKKVIDQGEAEEKKKKISETNSKIKQFKNRFDE